MDHLLYHDLDHDLVDHDESGSREIDRKKAEELSFLSERIEVGE